MKKIAPIIVLLCIFLAACGATPQRSQSSNISNILTGPMVSAPADTKVQTSTTIGADGLISMDITWEPID